MTELRYLGIQIRASYEESKNATFANVEQNIKHKIFKVNSSFLDMFHKRQLIQQAIFPGFNHVFMIFGSNPTWEEEIYKIIIKLLWHKKRDGHIIKGRSMIAKKRLEMDFTYGSLKMNFTKEISQGLMLNTLQRLFLQESSHERQQIFMYKLVRK